ncbi:MAG: PEP-CTERM sorting domain-containing protein [Phycisphaerae bacterium]|jgi:hypothetical protein
MSYRRAGIEALICLLFIAGAVPLYATFGYSYVNPNPPIQTEKNHAEILADTYGGAFTADGHNFVGSGASTGITAIRVYDFDSITYNTTHIYTHEETDVDQIWSDGVLTITAYARYAAYNQSFGWNGGGTGGQNYQELVNQSDIGGPGHTFEITAGQEFLWGHQAQSRDWWESDKKEWWSRDSENSWWGSEDHMVTYYMQGAGAGEAVWMIFIEDEKLCDSDKDYNDFVVEVRAVPEPTTIGLIGLGFLALRRRR